MDTVRIVQRFHSLFYTPQFVAMHLGVFKDEGLQIALSTATSGAELSAKVVRGEADLGLSGPIRSLQLAEQGSTERLISVIEVNSRDGFFVLARQPQPGFRWSHLTGRRFIAFAEAPTPWLCLQHVLRRQGLDLGTITVLQDVPSADAVAMFLRGEADYLEQAQPIAETLTTDGLAAIVASEGEAVGALPFSSYITIPAFAAAHADVLHRFTRAFYRAQQWMAHHTAEDIAHLIAPSFTAIEASMRTRILARYLRQHTWARDPLLRQEGFEYLQDILLGAGFMTQRYAYHDHVNPEFAHEAMRGV